jgi:hypothetical protein
MEISQIFVYQLWPILYEASHLLIYLIVLYVLHISTLSGKGSQCPWFR